jgi:phosphoribosylamine---glycine ligase
MRILVIGSGGREHALVWKISQSKLADKIFCAPGNGGISQMAECIDIKADNLPGLLEFARREKIDLTVVGPEMPLTAGIVDVFNNHRLSVFGPNKQAAQLEGSKVFAKQLMEKYGVPTARFKVFDDPLAAKQYIKRIGAPCVVKADGLAQGKGVVVAKTIDEAQQAVSAIMEEKIFGDAGSKVIIEDCLQGQEASILVITDSKTVIPLASSQDHKRVFDHDQGPNTGGMGAYSPAPIVTEPLFKQIMETAIYRMIDGLAKEGIEYRGVLYAGIMLTKEGPQVLEFNVRFGDPETQAILPRMKSDLLEVMLTAANRKLDRIAHAGGLSWDKSACVCVVCTSKGYPGDYEKGKQISGLADAAAIKDVVVFHAATQKAAGLRPQVLDFVTAGGRVLGVTGMGGTIKDAMATAYKAVDKIHFAGMHFRKDIGRKAYE